MLSASDLGLANGVLGVRATCNSPGLGQVRHGRAVARPPGVLDVVDLQRGRARSRPFSSSGKSGVGDHRVRLDAGGPDHRVGLELVPSESTT